MDDPWHGWWTTPDRLQAQWAEHRRLEALVAAVKRGQTGITLLPFESAGDPAQGSAGRSRSWETPDGQPLDCRDG